MSVLRTVFSDDAHLAATRDRSATADLILQLAVKEALAFIRAGRTGKAEWRLHKATMAAERISGRVPIGHGTVWTRHGVGSHTCSEACAATASHCCWGGVRRPHTFTDGVCIWCHTVEAEAVTR